MTHTCEYCSKDFKTDRGFNAHACKRKKTAEKVGKRHVVAAYELFKFWYMYNGFAKKTPKSFESFLKSPYFENFIDLYQSTKEVYMFNRKDFVVWLSSHQIAIDKWSDNPTLTKYLDEQSKRGKAIDQFSRSIENMVLWCDIHNVDYTHFFESITISEAMMWVQSGKLSPWHLLLTDSASKLFDRMTDHQLEYVLNFVDVDYWDARFKVCADDVDQIKSILNEFGF